MQHQWVNSTWQRLIFLCVCTQDCCAIEVGKYHYRFLKLDNWGCGEKLTWITGVYMEDDVGSLPLWTPLWRWISGGKFGLVAPCSKTIALLLSRLRAGPDSQIVYWNNVVIQLKSYGQNWRNLFCFPKCQCNSWCLISRSTLRFVVFFHAGKKAEISLENTYSVR